MLLPSTIHAGTWLIATSLMALEMNNVIGSGNIYINYNYVAPFILYLVISSIIGFSFAHVFAYSDRVQRISQTIVPYDVIDRILIKYKWVLYVCLICGIALTTFIISVGGFKSFYDYREVAVTIERVGYAAVAQRISGHIGIIGSFYLMLLGYKHAQTGINIKEFFVDLLMFASINLAIGGRVWILTSILPYMITYILVKNVTGKKIFSLKQKDSIFLLQVIVVFFAAFSIIGVIRNDSDNGKAKFSDKFLYYTDGPKMTNMVLQQYPPGSYNLEYGKCEFLSQWIDSPMIIRFKKSIAHDPGLSVTVKSAMPNLYYDFGYTGGIIIWGVLCFLLELTCLRLKNKRSIIGIMLFGLLTSILFQAPIGAVFNNNIVNLEWLFIIYLFRKPLFGSIKGASHYI